MKRLTISMSDELFDKLDNIDNKSLFVRKLVERELDMLGNHPESDISHNPDIKILKETISSLNKRMAEIERHFTTESKLEATEAIIQSDAQENTSRPYDEEIGPRPTTTRPESAPELELQVEASAENPVAMPELKPPGENPAESPIAMPELKSPVKSPAESPIAMPELKPPAENPVENPVAMPEIKPPVETPVENSFTMPELKPPAETQADNPFTMPELKPQVETPAEAPFAMPELKPPGETPADNPFTMPELKPSVETPADNPFTMSELKPPEESPAENPIVMPNFETAANMPEFTAPSEAPKETPVIIPDFGTSNDNQPVSNSGNLPPFELPEMAENTQQTTIPGNQPPNESMMNDVLNPPAFDNPPQQIQSDRSKFDKLESNILMYMPHGAKVKKSIIESLVSKQYTDDEIKAKIQEMFSKQVLSNIIEDGAEYLIRP